MEDDDAGSLQRSTILQDHDDWNMHNMMMTPRPNIPNEQNASEIVRLQESIASLQRAFEAAMSSRHSNAPPPVTADPCHPSVPFQAQDIPHATVSRGPQVT